MSILEETAVKALGHTIQVDEERRRVSIIIDILTTTPTIDLMTLVGDAWLEYVESIRTTGPALIQRHRLTVIGTTVRLAVVQNVVKAAVLGDAHMLERCTSVARQLSV